LAEWPNAARLFFLIYFRRSAIMTNPNFGLQFIQLDDQPIPVLGANMDVIGVVAPCSTADPNTFPINTPTLVYSNDTVTIAKLGNDGYIVDAINGINDQLADFQVAAQLVIVVTPYGTAADANLKLQQTIANIMGQSAAGTGIFALLKAPMALYCTPRIILTPGYTGQMANSLDTLNVTTTGVGYTPGQIYQLTFMQGIGETNGANLILPIAHAVADANGRIDDPQVFIDTWGAWMTVAPTISMPPPDGGVPQAAPAGGQLIFSQNPGVGATITLNGTVVQFVSSQQPGARANAPTLTGGTATTSAAGSIEFFTNPVNNNTISLGGTTVTFVPSGATGNQCNIGVTLDATLTNLQTMLNGSADVNISKCTYLKSGSYIINITYKTVGTTGNTFALATNVTPPLNQVTLAPDLFDTLQALLTFLTNSTDPQIALCTYTLNQGTITLITKAQNSAANGFTLGTTVTGLTLSGPTLTGGSNAGSLTTATIIAAIALGANPVCASLTPVLDTLIGHAIVESAGTSQIGDVSWRSTMDSERIIPLSGGVKIQDPISSAIVVRPLAPRVAGLLIARDFATGYPFHSAANEPIQGIVGPARTIMFSLTDGATEGQQLIGANLGIVVRGAVGVETAISSGGFVFIGTDNAGSDPLWQMYNVKRGRDFIHLSLMPALRTYLGRSNIDRQTITNVYTTIKDFLSTLKARQQIIDFKVDFLGSQNSADQIRLGHLVVQFEAEEPPVLKVITTMSARYKPAIDMMVAELAQQLNTSA
jgi:phage tail sheath protein FI